MSDQVKISNLNNFQVSDLNMVKSDRVIFITSHPEDLRTKKLLSMVKETIENVEIIFTDSESDLKRKTYINDIKSIETLSIIIDTSLIKRSCLAGIFSEVYQLCYTVEVNYYIFYSLGSYVPPSDEQPHPNKRVASVHPRFMGWDDEQTLKVMAIVGLGYEKDKAIGAVEYLESLRTILFIPESSEAEYLKDVKTQNDHLISSTSKKDQIFYEVENPVKTVLKIDSVLSDCNKQYKPVLLPFGPKIFYACSLLAAMAHPNASVWYVSGEESERKRNNQLPVSTFGMKCVISSLPSSNESE